MKIPAHSMRKQRGVVLLVGLIMVLLMTVVGLAAIRGSGLQESMASNMRDMNVSFQAAESMLAACEGEVDIDQNAVLPTFNNYKGAWTDRNQNPSESVIYWDADTWEEKGMTIPLGLAVEKEPSCVIEQLDYPPGTFSEASCLDAGCTGTVGDPQMFRISSAAIDPSGEIRSSLQSTFKRRFQ